MVEFTYDGNMKYTKWKINNSGWVTFEYEYSIEGDQPFTGVSFSYPENYVYQIAGLAKAHHASGKTVCRERK